jgi:phosphotransferase system IIA component
MKNKNKEVTKIKNQKTGKYVDINKVPDSAFFE